MPGSVAPVGLAAHHSVGAPTHPNEWQIYPSGRFQEDGKSICFQMEYPGTSASFGKLGTTLGRMGAAVDDSRPLSSHEDVRSLLSRLLTAVVNEREPGIAGVLAGRVSLDTLADGQRIPALQATGIWFQLVAIANELLAMRSRRELEQMRARTEARLALSTESGYATGRALSEFYLGWADALAGDIEDGIARMSQGREELFWVRLAGVSAGPFHIEPTMLLGKAGQNQ